MASKIPDSVILAHNEMVLDLDKCLEHWELEELIGHLKDDPLTTTDIGRIDSVQQLFLCLMGKTFIRYGDYEKLVPKLILVKPVLGEITDGCMEKIKKLLNRKKHSTNVTISMDKPVYQTKEGDAAFLTCSVYPKPDQIVWKKDKSAKPSEIVPIDNRKYFYGIEAPTLVIKDPYKIYDEAHYQCTAKAHRKTIDGQVVQLQVTAVTDSCRTTSSVGPSDEMSRSSTTGLEDLNADIRHSESEDHLPPRRRKRVKSDSDKGCQMIFNITNDIDIKRRKTNNDITETFERVTRCEHGRVETNLEQKCIQVSLNITPTEKPLKPSSVYLAEEFKHFLLDGGTIQLSDESRTVLQIDKNSFEIIPLDAPEGGSPWVNISHGMFEVTVGKTATIQTFIIASPEVTSVQWYRVDEDEYVPLQIDNKRYFAGSILSPTLIIRETIIDDQGEYVCSATNSNGTGWSGIATLALESAEARNQSTETNFDPSQKILKGEEVDVCDEFTYPLDRDTAEKYVADSGISSTVPPKSHPIVAAIDIGTTYSGYAFSSFTDYQRDPLHISGRSWAAGSGGLMSLKTSTCVLFDPDGTFHSFGYEAEDKYSDLALDEEHQGWRYFRRFKMQLYGNKCLNRSFTIEDDQGQSMQAIKVFTAAIKYLKDHMMKTYNNQMTGIKPTDILWVITVPAIWSDASKQFMREAAEAACIGRDHLNIALEPEVASLYCRYLPLERKEDGMKALSSGSKYVVLDAGGGTIDITVHEVQRDGSLKEIHKASGGDWGGTKVDHAFQLLLSGIIGNDAFHRFMENNKADMVEFFRDFEVKKRKIKPDARSDEKVFFNVPQTMNDVCRDENNQDIATIMKSKSHLKETMSFFAGKLRLNGDKAKDLFKDPVKHIVDDLKKLFREPSTRGLTSILMVGGFSESLVLQNEIKRNFPTFRIIVPEDAGIAVLKGAVIFGHEPRTIKSRICKYTYGVDAVRVFNDKVHDISKRRVLSGKRVKIDDIFSIHVRKGDSVNIGAQFAQWYVPIEPDQTGMIFNVYTSTERDPMYVTDPGCMKIGQLSINMPDTSKGLNRSIKVQMSYSDTEIQVNAIDRENGECVSGEFDLLVA